MFCDDILHSKTKTKTLEIRQDNESMSATQIVRRRMRLMQDGIKSSDGIVDDEKKCLRAASVDVGQIMVSAKTAPVVADKFPTDSDDPNADRGALFFFGFDWRIVAVSKIQSGHSHSATS